MSDLISTEQAATILGVGRARVFQLRAEAPGFPAPIWRGRVEMAWSRVEIEAWATANGYPRGAR